MDEKYEEYETDDTEKKKFRLTRGMLLIGIAILLLIIIIIVVIVIKNKNKEYALTNSDCERLESKMLEEAEVYVGNNNIELTEDVIRVKLSDLLEENNGTISTQSYPAATKCDGYVEASQVDKEDIYDAYLSCENGYKTKGYKTEEELKGAKPVIKLKGNKEMTIYVGDKYTEFGATATDEEDGNLTNKIKTSGKVDTNKKGTYKITYSVTDSDGNKASVKRTVKVKQKTTTSTTTTTTATVSSTTTTTTKKVVTSKVYTTRTSRTNNKATTKRVYQNTTRKVTTTKKRITTPPTITLNGSKTVTITKGKTYVDAGATAKDALGTNITGRITKSGTVNTNKTGTYFIIYKVTDSYNNMASATRTVVVKEEVSVTGITISPNALTISKGGIYTLKAYITPSNASASITWSSSNTKIATVSNGTVKGIASGSCYITARAGSKSATTLLTVK